MIRRIGLFGIIMLWGACAFAATPTPTPIAHPCLYFDAADIPTLAARLGDGHLAGSSYAVGSTTSDTKVHSALEACLRGERSDSAIAYLMDYVTHVEATGEFSSGEYRWTPTYAFVYDYQYNYMTATERSRTEAVFADDAAYVLDLAENSGMWYFMVEHVNNWTTGHMTDYVFQRLLYYSILLPQHAGASAWQDKALELITGWLSRCPGAIDGQPGEMIDETLTAPGGYGLWDVTSFCDFMPIMARHTSVDPYAYAGGLMHSEGIYRTYVLSFREGEQYHFFSKASYVGAGHGYFNFIAPYDNVHLLNLAYHYNDPVLAWHFYANPSPSVRGSYEDFLSRWNNPAPPTGWRNIQYLLYWGQIQPQTPDQQSWNLSRHFTGAGAAVIRKSWNKNNGMIWIRAGYGGSHYQPSQGTVIYHADSAVILGNGGAQNYSPDSRMNNVLLVDGAGQISPYPGVPAQREKYGTLTRIDDDTFQADASAAYADMDCGLHWTRQVHYERSADILAIRDQVTVDDDQYHDLYFNWVTQATVINHYKYQLPAGYLMLARANRGLTAQSTTVEIDSAFETLGVLAQSKSLDVSWYIGRDETALLAYIEQSGDSSSVFGGTAQADVVCLNNIFNPEKGESAIIRVQQTAPGPLKVAIYSSQGAIVNILVNEERASSVYDFRWDGKDRTGRLVGSGLYLVRVNAAGHHATKKIIVVK